MLTSRKVLILGLFLAVCFNSHGHLIMVQPADTSDYITGDKNYNLLIAAEKGILKDVKTLIKSGADVNTKTYEGVTPLMYAAQRGHVEVIEFLVEKGADIELKPLDGVSALIGAVMFNQLDVVELLIRKNANIDIRDTKGATPLMYALAYDYFVMADMLLYYEASLDVEDKQGNSPLSVAVYLGSYEFTELLLDNGAVVNHRDNKGNTPLIIASQFGYNDIADLLILYSADINIQNNSNLSALHYAVESNNVRLVKLLIKKGANVNHKLNYAENSLTIARRNKNDSIRTILLNNGAKSNYKPSISEINMGVNGTFNRYDFISGFQITLDEQKYKFGFNAGIEYRPWRIRILDEKENNEYYQLWERRALVYGGLTKKIKIHQISYKQSLEAVVAANAGYTWGSYRGFIKGPETKYMFLPEVGLVINKPNSRIYFTYQYKDFKVTKISPHRFNISLMFTINIAKNKFKQHYINWLR